MSDASPSPDSFVPGEVPDYLPEWLAPRLISWFHNHHRPLPWRRDRDPYRIWVSEVMLQQTQVATVIPYFERFLARFPTLLDLARADEAEVLRLWEGLGYYRRARDLLRSARQMAERHGGRIPADPEALDGLPGLGEYTRNAVLSQAFDLRLPILEANSQRVLSRVLGQADDPRQGPARRRLWNAAQRLLPDRETGAFNQGLMELGALICTPTAPRCSDCPLSACCSAYRMGKQESIPERSPRPAITAVRETGVVIARGSEVLLLQRPGQGRWANLWEFPHGEVLVDEDHEDAVVRIARELTGLAVRSGPEVVRIQHGVTRYRITLACFEAVPLSGELRPTQHVQGIWLDRAVLGGYPLSAPQRRLVEALSREGRQPSLF